MTQQEIEDELKSLREQEQVRRKNWESVRKSAMFGSIVYLIGGIGLLAFSIVYPGHETFQIAIMLAMLSLPFSLLRRALSSP